MTSVCLYFKVHQPNRLKSYSGKDININHCYEDHLANKAAVDIASESCYLPANELLIRLLKTNVDVRINFSISGVVLELFEKYRPDVLQSFQDLLANENVEILGETCSHTLSSIYSPGEFKEQVQRHSKLIWKYFKKQPKVFRNTELIHSNRIAECIFGLGFKGILCEGVESLLNGRSPNHPYSVPGVENGCLLLRNSRLSDDIAFRFDDKNWSEHPLTAEKFAEWIHAHPRHSEVINISMDYETFGLHKSPESNIFEFLKALPAAVIAQPEFRLSTASETLEWFAPKDFYDVPNTISWEDMQSASCVWTNNVNQHNTLGKIYSLEKLVRQSGCPRFLETWRHLQSADNFYFMDGQPRTDKKKYINPFSSASEAFMNYTNIVTDFEISLIRKGLKIVKHGNRAKTKQHLFY